MDMSVWYLLGAVLVFFMQCGFAMVETGFTRAKNAGNIIMKNLMDFCIGTVVFFVLGYGIMNSENYFFGLIGRPEYQMFTDFANFDLLQFLLPVSILCNGSNNRFRSNGRKNKVLYILYLFRSYQCNRIPD